MATLPTRPVSTGYHRLGIVLIRLLRRGPLEIWPVDAVAASDAKRLGQAKRVNGVSKGVFSKGLFSDHITLFRTT